MELIALVTVLVAAEYFFLAIMVGKCRSETGISAPNILGDEKFERVFRVQQNTMEQLVIFIPTMLAFSMYTSARWALLPGVLFIAGRQLYYHQYVSDPASRTPGMALTLLANVILLFGAMIGLLMSMV